MAPQNTVPITKIGTLYLNNRTSIMLLPCAPDLPLMGWAGQTVSLSDKLTGRYAHHPGYVTRGKRRVGEGEKEGWVKGQYKERGERREGGVTGRDR